MKPALRLICILLCSCVLRAQAPASSLPQTPAANPPQAALPNPLQALPSYLPPQTPNEPTGPVPISEEPHHRLVLQNEFVRVYNVTVPGLDSTLLHQHDLPYLYVVMGPADLVNAVVGKPEVHQVMQDGETHYSPGHFAHLVRTDSGVEFHNITIELAHPQGTPKNLCREVLPGAPLNCPAPPAAAESSKTKKSESEPAVEDVPYFETDEIRVDLHKVSNGNDYVDAKPQTDALLVALTNANLDANLAGEHVQFLHGGDVLWLPAGQRRRIVDFLGTHSSFMLITFKDSAPPATR
jgi:hypothetical protein